MKRTASPSDLEAKNPPAEGPLGRFWKWRYRASAQNELALLLDLDCSDVDQVVDSGALSSASALHNACAPSALLQWQFESRISTEKRPAKLKRQPF